jgi:hypothetical protein
MHVFIDGTLGGSESSDESGPLLLFTLVSVGPCHAEERSCRTLNGTNDNFTMKSIGNPADEPAAMRHSAREQSV